jgi:hypothetical protein
VTVSAAFLVKDPPLDRLVQLVEVLRPVVGEFVIVVDDRTPPSVVEVMASWHGVTTVPFTWVDDFAAARNAALPFCTGRWILHLDPDEMPTLGLLQFIAMVDALDERDEVWHDVIFPAARGYLIFTRNYFDGKQGEEWEEHWHCRLFRNEPDTHWYKPVHEQVALGGQAEVYMRETSLLRKAPRSAAIIHSRMNRPEIDEQYAAIGERGSSGA